MYSIANVGRERADKLNNTNIGGIMHCTGFSTISHTAPVIASIVNINSDHEYYCADCLARYQEYLEAMNWTDQITFLS